MRLRWALLGIVVATGVPLAIRRDHSAPELVLAGVIEARDVRAGSLIGGRVKNVLVEEGASVSRGAPLLTMESDLVDLAIVEQRNRLSEALAHLALVREGPRQEEASRARLAWESAENERKRSEALLRDGLTSPQIHDAAKTLANTRLEALKEVERGSRAEDVRAAQAVADREATRLAYLKRQRTETVVVAPVGGIVQTLAFRPGDIVSPNEPVAEILESGQLWLNAYLPEPRLGRVRVGQAVYISLDGFPARIFRGRVAAIGERSEYMPRNVQTLDQRADQVFRVKIAIDPVEEIKAGMAAVVHLQSVESRTVD